VFLRTCGACHKLHGDGGTIGPDLTGANRSSLDYLLLNVLNPNGEVADAYKMTVVTTRDGRTYSGLPAGETERTLTLRVIGRDSVTIAKAEIQAREATPSSMMPPGLFEALGDREVVDLVAYLRALEPIR
jgi:putative heme-binding domain-containing protein